MENRQKNARIAGLLYLIFIIFSVCADQFASFAQTTTAQTIQKIHANPPLFTIGLVCNVLSGLFFFLTAWALYKLLKEVNHDLALLLMLLNLAGVVIQCLSVAFLFAGKELLTGAINPDQLNDLSRVFINIYQNGFLIAQIFYGLWLLPLGILIYKSTFMHKFLGVLILVDCVAIVLWFFQYFLFPQVVMVANLCLLVSLIAEVCLTFGLLLNGITLKKKTA